MIYLNKENCLENVSDNIKNREMVQNIWYWSHKKNFHFFKTQGKIKYSVQSKDYFSKDVDLFEIKATNK